MSRVNNQYTDNLFTEAAKQAQSAVESKSKQTQAVKKDGQTDAAKQTKLSAKAQNLLEKLKKTYGNMDFMVADFESGAEAKEILSRGTKEFSVLFSSEELEKMASSQKYEKEYLQKVEGAVRMSNQINEQFGFGPAGDKGKLNSVGISFNSDGTTTLFAELEKSSDQQRARIDEAREKRAAEKKDAPAKKVTVQASTQKELMQKLNALDWEKIKDTKKVTGDKFDFTV